MSSDKHDHHNHSHGHGHSHGHSHGGELSGTKFFMVTVMNVTITVAEIIGGILSGSLALLSDALHNFSDTIAIVISYFAYRIGKKDPNASMSFGYKRAEILAAFVNSTTLVGISLFLMYEAVQRFIHPQAIESTLMIGVAAIGLVANVISVLLLERDKDHSTNIKASYLHLLGDAVSSVGVVIGGILIKFWGITIVDPIITLLISIYIIREAWHIVKESTAILMQSTVELDYDGIKKSVLACNSVQNIHHIHSWKLNENKIYFEAHIVIEDMMLSQADTISIDIENMLKEHFGIHHCTLKFETEKVCHTDNLFNMEE